MDKKYVFTGIGSGTAKVKNGVAEITISPAKALLPEECFVVFASGDGKLVKLGELYGSCGSFAGCKNANALMIVRKNRKNGVCNLEMWGECRMNGEEFFQPGAKLQKNGKTTQSDKRNTVFGFENFLNMDFSWRRIGGYFMPCNYKIMRYVMSCENVYRCVNSRGHYMLGEKEEDGVRYIAAAVPIVKNMPEAFGQFKEKAYTIESGSTVYSAVCMGIDESGEFFVYL